MVYWRCGGGRRGPGQEGLFTFVIISADDVRHQFLGENPSALCTCTECGNEKKFPHVKTQPLTEASPSETGG